MPFWKYKNNFQPLWKDWEVKAKRNGMRHSIFTIQKDKYIGEWKNDKKHGKGACYYSNDTLYEGDWENDLRHGFGVQSRKLINNTYGLVYQGYWLSGKRDGYGWQHCINGDVYEGHWKEGKKEGFGKMWYTDGSFYIGDWSNDYQHGFGVLIKVNGNIYSGQFENGLRRGEGTLHHIEAKCMQEGLWGYGSAVSSSMEYEVRLQLNNTRPETSIAKMKCSSILRLHRKQLEEMIEL